VKTTTKFIRSCHDFPHKTIMWMILLLLLYLARAAGGNGETDAADAADGAGSSEAAALSRLNRDPAAAVKTDATEAPEPREYQLSVSLGGLHPVHAANPPSSEGFPKATLAQDDASATLPPLPVRDEDLLLSLEPPVSVPTLESPTWESRPSQPSSTAPEPTHQGILLPAERSQPANAADPEQLTFDEWKDLLANDEQAMPPQGPHLASPLSGSARMHADPPYRSAMVLRLHRSSLSVSLCV
jgi:hypothetical protein